MSVNPAAWIPATSHYGKDPNKECECFLHRRIRVLEAENAALKGEAKALWKGIA